MFALLAYDKKKFIKVIYFFKNYPHYSILGCNHGNHFLHWSIDYSNTFLIQVVDKTDHSSNNKLQHFDDKIADMENDIEKISLYQLLFAIYKLIYERAYVRVDIEIDIELICPSDIIPSKLEPF